MLYKIGHCSHQITPAVNQLPTDHKLWRCAQPYQSIGLWQGNNGIRLCLMIARTLVRILLPTTDIRDEINNKWPTKLNTKLLEHKNAGLTIYFDPPPDNFLMQILQDAKRRIREKMHQNQSKMMIGNRCCCGCNYHSSFSPVS